MKKFFAALPVLLALAAATANALTAEITDSSGAPLNLTLDIDASQGSSFQGTLFQYCNSSSYSDLAYCNQNAFVKICDAQNLTGNYTGIAYKVGTNPAKMRWILVSSYGGQSMGSLFPITNWSDSTHCALVDVDLSFFRAVYPAIPEVVFSSDAFADDGDTFIPLTTATMLKGTYVFTNQSLPGDILSINVAGAYAENTQAEYSAPLLVVGTENAAQQVCDVNITSPNQPINLSLFSGGIDCRESTVVNINGIRTPVNLMYCNDGVQDYGETGVDCGGPCPPCPVNVTTYLAFIKPDGTAGCLEMTTQPFNVTVRLVVAGQRLCDENHTFLSMLAPSGKTATYNASSCANGDHLFAVELEGAGTYHFVAFSNATDYSPKSIHCDVTFNPTEFIARLPDAHPLAAVAAGLLAFLLFFKLGKQNKKRK